MVVVLVSIGLGSDGELLGHRGSFTFSSWWGRTAGAANIDDDCMLCLFKVKTRVLTVAIAGASTVEAEQADVDTIGTILIIEAEGAFLLVYMLRGTWRSQCHEGGAEMWTSHVGLSRVNGAIPLS